MAISSATDIPPVVDITTKLQNLLDRASSVKPETTLEPPLPVSPFSDDINALYDVFGETHDGLYRFYCVEKAARDIFYPLMRGTSIHDPAFVSVWNLLDLLIMCGDHGKGDVALVCWLIEELLDSQTTRDCRTVFDYLESRRERLVQKGFHGKNLVLLRSCNELLRRLSRAEDAKFCGRVFFFLFQTFPLGDKSSVNLRGEFHVENTTRFEVPEFRREPDGENMEIDAEPVKAGNETPKAATPQPMAKPGSKAVPIKAPSKKAEEPKLLSNDELYPIFWRLQQDFSDPTRLFTAGHFEIFKKGLASTIAKFKNTPAVVQTKSSEDKDAQRGTKRKLGEDGTARTDGDEGFDRSPVSGDRKDHFLDNYNPKYLTSRDLFDLELSDQAFQRHILVQALILIDFLLSLTEKVKKTLVALGSATNKALLYNFTLNEEDTRWANSTRATITNYFTVDQEGKLFNRMVDTVLVRDKNWVRWKIESCPSIVRDPVSAESEMAARKGAREWTKIRRVPAKPAGSMDLSFLDEGIGGGLAALQDPVRYTTASIDELIDGIKTDELDLDFAMDDEEKAMLQNAMANKRWRILRQARATRLELLDKVDPGKDLNTVFRPPREPTPQEVETIDAAVTVADSEEVVAMDTAATTAESEEVGTVDAAAITVESEEIGTVDAAAITAETEEEPQRDENIDSDAAETNGMSGDMATITATDERAAVQEDNSEDT